MAYVVTINASQTIVNPNTQVVLSWSVPQEHAGSGSGAIISATSSGWQPVGVPTAGIDQSTLTVTVAITTTYTLTVTDQFDVVAVASVTVVVNPPTVTISASPNPCPTGNTLTLTYSSSGASALSIDNNIGSVSGPSGTINIANFTLATIYMITATGPTGITSTASVSVPVLIPPPPSSLIVTPITAPFDQQFNSGYNYPADTYTLTYTDGAMRYNNALAQWFRPSVHITDHAGNDQSWAASAAYATSAACIAAEVGATFQYVHVGGPISLTFVDSFYGDNDETTPGPTYQLTGAPVIPFSPISGTISASPSSIVAGGTSTVSWSSTNATAASLVTIGTVAPTGTTVVTPVVLSPYSIVFSGQSATTVTAMTTVTVTPLASAFNLLARGLCGNNISLSWSPTPATPIYVVSRNADASTNYTVIATVTANALLDTPAGSGPVPYVSEYYVVQSLLGTVTSSYSSVVMAQSRDVPSAVTGLTVSAFPGALVVTMPPAPHADFYVISKATASGQEQACATVAIPYFYDSSVVGSTAAWYYKVNSVNQCGTAAASSEVSASLSSPLPVQIVGGNPGSGAQDAAGTTPFFRG